MPNTGGSSSDSLIAVLGGVALCAVAYRRPGRHS
ncbi:LPXTG cell wall anchor domain-containing protein [Kitasatospora sp. NPDC087861]